MSGKGILEGNYICPQCGEEFELNSILEGSEASCCPNCQVELEPIEEVIGAY